MEDAPVLLVVFGAGASHDCMVNDEAHEWKPPLTRDVFDLTRRHYSNIANDFPAAAPVIDEVAQNLNADPDSTLERELARIVSEAETWPERKIALLAVEFYLGQLFRECSKRMADHRRRSAMDCSEGASAPVLPQRSRSSPDRSAATGRRR